MSHVDLKKSQCPMSLNLSCPMSSLCYPNVACRYKEMTHVVSLILIFMSLGSICHMSILRNGHVALSILGVKGHSLKAQPHAAMLHICGGVFQNSCDAGKLPAMVCDAFSNMLVILLPILEYLSYFLSDFATIFSKMKEM